MTAVVLIGSLPLPYGGVTVFNSRLAHRLALRNRLRLLLLPKGVFSVARLLWFRLSCRDDYVIYYSAGSVGWFLVFMLLGVLDRVVFFDHNSSRHWRSLSAWQQKVLRLCVPRIRYVLLAGAHLSANYQGFFKQHIPRRAFSTFIPPAPAEEARITSGYPEALQRVLAQEQRRIVICSAYCPVQTVAGGDLYGLARTSALFDQLAPLHGDVIFLFVIGQWGQGDFSSQIKGLLEAQAERVGNVLLLSGDFQLWPLFRKAKCLLRPTLTDGDSVSVKEAIFFGAPVIASNVVPRPAPVRSVDLDGSAYEEAVVQMLGGEGDAWR